MPPEANERSGTTNCNTDLTEPLLSQENNCVCVVDNDNDTNDDDGCDNEETVSDGNDIGNGNGNDNDDANFCLRQEIFDMISLGFPLAISFFCRMGMASTDSAFVGHIRNDEHSPQIYLAAAVLSDMVLNICITPPLAFNQVLNGLVSQAMGSNNPHMAGIWLQQSMFWLSISMLPCLIGLLYVEPILLLLGFPSDISLLAGTYAKYNIIWPIPNGWYQCMRFYFQARGLPRPAMYNNIIFFFLNALFNWIFVFGGPFQNWNGLGFIGAAISLSMSRTMQPLCYYLYMFVYKKNHLDAWPEKGWSISHHTSDRTKEFMKQSIPNIGTLLFQAFASQTQTVLVGRLGTLSIAASSALSTITIPWSGTLSATCCTVSSVRVGYHLGKGNAMAAKRSSWIVMYFITIMNGIMAIFFLVPYFKNKVITIATDDKDVIALSKTLIPAMLVASYLNLLVNNGTSGIFMGQGRPLIATILSFGLELPLSIGGVAIYILYYHGNLLGVYWWSAISAGIEIIIVLYLVSTSNWTKCAEEARERQETIRSCDDDNNDDNDNDNLEEGINNNNNRDLEEDQGDESNRLLDFQSPSMVGMEDRTNAIPRRDDDNEKFYFDERNTGTKNIDLEENRGEKLLVVAADLRGEKKETAEVEEQTRMQQAEKKQRQVHVYEEEKRRMDVAEAEAKAKADVLTTKVKGAAASTTSTTEEEEQERVQAKKKCRQEEEKKRQIQVEAKAKANALATKVKAAAASEEERKRIQTQDDKRKISQEEKERRQIQAEVKAKADVDALATKVKVQAVEDERKQEGDERRQMQVKSKGKADADVLAKKAEAQAAAKERTRMQAEKRRQAEEERRQIQAEANEEADAEVAEVADGARDDGESETTT